MSVILKYGFLYAMNIINDCSSYIWTIALKSKADTANALQVWHRGVENQSNEHLKILVTNNEELLSNDTVKWCTEHGIEHQLMAPYTSVKNGHAE